MDLNCDENKYLVLLYTTSDLGGFKCFFSLSKLTSPPKKKLSLCF